MAKLIAFALVAALGTSAAADPGFVWQATDDSCPDSDEVRVRIERRLGMALDVRGVEVAISRDRNGFVATINMRGVTLANQNRTLTSAVCDQLADAVAVIVARLANEQRPTRVASLSNEATEVPAASTTTVVQPVVRPVAVRRPWGAGLRGLGVSGIGAQPHVGIGGELAGFVRHQRWFGELGVARWRKTSAYFSPGAGASSAWRPSRFALAGRLQTSQSARGPGSSSAGSPVRASPWSIRAPAPGAGSPPRRGSVWRGQSPVISVSSARSSSRFRSAARRSRSITEA
ncbi:MAG: hypothetical protein WKG01_15700 [Kofleriaceae bacterium]